MFLKFQKILASEQLIIVLIMSIGTPSTKDLD